MIATTGRIVHFVTEAGAVRPAMVVEDFGVSAGISLIADDAAESQLVNLQVFTDGENDNHHAGGPALIWQKEVPQHRPTEGEPFQPNTWHWPRLLMGTDRGDPRGDFTRTAKLISPDPLSEQQVSEAIHSAGRAPDQPGELS
jgi:hypothetical protein